MIRVLHVVTHMNRGGLETMIMNDYRHMNREKVQFDFLVHRSYKADYDDEIEQLGGKLYRISRLNPFSLAYRKELNNFFKVHPEYQIIHVHQDCLSSVILKAAKKNGVKTRIAHSHSSSQDKNLKYLVKLFYRRKIPKYATDLLACGEQAGSWMFSGAAFHVLNNAIDTKKYAFHEDKRKEIRKRLEIKESEIVLGHVGRFSPAKNHDFLIEIFQSITEKTNAKLLLIGDGELREKTEHKVELLGLKNQVIFTGVCSEVADFMQAMDVFVFPSLYEGFPVTLVEAQAAGLPCVISSAVPKESVLIPESVKSLKLTEPLRRWRKEILQSAKMIRKDMSNKIREKGFDVEESAKWLERFYCDKLRKQTGGRNGFY